MMRRRVEKLSERSLDGDGVSQGLCKIGWGLWWLSAGHVQFTTLDVVKQMIWFDDAASDKRYTTWEFSMLFKVDVGYQTALNSTTFCQAETIHYRQRNRDLYTTIIEIAHSFQSNSQQKLPFVFRVLCRKCAY
jgi:hypothetical protein